MPNALRAPGDSPLVAALRLAGSREVAAELERTLLGANAGLVTKRRDERRRHLRRRPHT